MPQQTLQQRRLQRTRHESIASSSTSGLVRLYSIIRDRNKVGVSPHVLAELRDAMKDVTLEELGIEHSRPRGGMTYLHMYEDEHVSMGIFCLPAQSRIPLHNHPGMSVVSKVLYGKLHVLSFDWAQSPVAERLATSVCDAVVGDVDDPAVLLPESGGNIHQFTALTDCAVLDLLSPPTAPSTGGTVHTTRLKRSSPMATPSWQSMNLHLAFAFSQNRTPGSSSRMVIPITIITRKSVGIRPTQSRAAAMTTRISNFLNVVQ
eukprot:jgi/Picre1/35176/NNA_002638.t1